MIFAVFAAFSVPAQAQQKTIILPVKTEKITSKPSVKTSVAQNFHRTDSLVMYERFQGLDLSRVRMSILIIKEKFQPLKLRASKFLGAQIIIPFKQEFVYA
jgi:hypothetical protein